MNNDIINLIKKLRDKKCNDLADLLKGCRSSTEETTQYGSYHNQFISGFIIYAPTDKYRELQKISEEDKNAILQYILELYPKSEELEIGFLNIKQLPGEDKIKENQALADSWLKRAKNKLDDGKQSLEKWRHAEAISSFQECIELSLKADSLLLLDKYSKDHKFDEKEFKEMLNQIPESLENQEFHKLYLYSKFWSIYLLPVLFFVLAFIRREIFSAWWKVALPVGIVFLVVIFVTPPLGENISADRTTMTAALVKIFVFVSAIVIAWKYWRLRSGRKIVG